LPDILLRPKIKLLCHKQRKHISFIKCAMSFA
jgi:hypothetical protein